MRIIEIKSGEDGIHQYQTISVNVPVPDGYALVPDDMELKNCPFGEVIAEEINGIMTVTDWIAGERPEIENPTETISISGSADAIWDELDAAYAEGVNSAYEQ